LLERWNGSSWNALVLSTAPAQASATLAAATCVSATDCWAVGGYSAGPSGGTLTEHWNGAAWVPSAGISQAGSAFLDAITCRSEQSCWAAGATVNNAGTPQALVRRWNGSAWSTVSSPAEVAALSGIGCLGPRRCWAVGAQSDGL